MDEKILVTIKNLLGDVIANSSDFDAELIIHINDALNRLNSLGIGVDGGLRITGSAESWRDFTTDETNLPMIQSYVYYKVKIVFDPPEHSYTLNTFEKLIDKYEWLLCCFADSYNREEVSG